MSSFWSKNMKREADMKDSKKMGWDTVGANSFIKMEDTMMESGKKIKCMAGENFITKEGS